MDQVMSDQARMVADAIAAAVRRCRVCGCTDVDCSGCIARTGMPCWWVADDLCSACVERPADESR